MVNWMLFPKDTRRMYYLRPPDTSTGSSRVFEEIMSLAPLLMQEIDFKLFLINGFVLSKSIKKKSTPSDIRF
jgi:hypothetical protein